MFVLVRDCREVLSEAHTNFVEGVGGWMSAVVLSMSVESLFRRLELLMGALRSRLKQQTLQLDALLFDG